MRTIKTGDGKVITLNDQQNEALQLLDEWKNDDKALFFLLAGYAGTGKTTISKEFLDSCPNWTIAVSAPTHVAKNIIEVSTGREGATLSSLMGIGPDTDVDDYDPDNPKFKEKRSPDFSKYNLVVVDESSMVNKALTKSLLAIAARFKTKVLFMGDKAQLPPIGEVVSDIFTTEQISYKYQLTEVMRQTDGNSLQVLYTKLRNNLQDPNGGIDKVSNLNSEGEGYEFIKLNRFATEISKKYTDPLFSPHSVKVLCWTNDEVQSWNKYIREKRMNALHPNTNIGIVFPGDVLMGMARRGEAIINSEQYLVKTCKLEMQTFVTGRLMGENMETNLFLIRVECTQVSNNANRVIYILNHNDPRAVKTWRDIYNYELNRATRTKKWHAFMDFRARAILMAPINVGAKNPVGPDIDYGYAMTVHKSQGSTYDEVFIHKDIWRNPIIVERNQLKYVAASRPRKAAHFLI